jgi:hypothetical protein
MERSVRSAETLPRFNFMKPAVLILPGLGALGLIAGGLFLLLNRSDPGPAAYQKAMNRLEGKWQGTITMAEGPAKGQVKSLLEIVQKEDQHRAVITLEGQSSPLKTIPLAYTETGQMLLDQTTYQPSGLVAFSQGAPEMVLKVGGAWGLQEVTLSQEGSRLEVTFREGKDPQTLKESESYDFMRSSNP